jgi:hypothetical protein
MIMKVGEQAKFLQRGFGKKQEEVWPDTLALAPVINDIPSEDGCRKPARMRDYLASLHRLSSSMECSGRALLVAASFSP